MPRGSPKCLNCKTTIGDESDYCKKCGMRLYFRCRKCGKRWFRSDGRLCLLCGEKATD